MLTISQWQHHIMCPASGSRPRMTAISFLTSNTILLATLCAGALAAGLIVYLRWSSQNRHLITAVDNMSQGLNMFDAQGRIVLVNRRYLDMYGLSHEAVKPGCSLRELIQHRKDTGLFKGDPESYSKKILAEMAER